jgi:hypothetical protein
VCLEAQLVPVCFLEPDEKQLANSRLIGLDFLLAKLCVGLPVGRGVE